MSLVIATPAMAVQDATVLCFNALMAANRPVARTSIVVGVPPWDDCCVGQLYGRIDRYYASARFPYEGTYVACARPTAAQVVIGLVRCYPSLDEGGNAPPAGDETTASLLLYEDALLLWSALQTEPWWPSGDVIVANQSFLSMGGCCAVETMMFVEVA